MAGGRQDNEPGTVVYRTLSRSGLDYGWNTVTEEEAAQLRAAGCILIPDPRKDMRGKKWLAGDGSKAGYRG